MVIGVGAQRGILTTIWVAGFLVGFGTLLRLYLNDAIAAENFVAAREAFFAACVPYLGVVLSFHFVEARQATQRTRGTGTFALASIISLSWNFVILVFLIRLLFGSGTIEDSTTQIRQLSESLQWFVAPVIGYYFASGQ